MFNAPGYKSVNFLTFLSCCSGKLHRMTSVTLTQHPAFAHLMTLMKQVYINNLKDAHHIVHTIELLNHVFACYCTKIFATSEV